jgi:hypothetical protein
MRGKAFKEKGKAMIQGAEKHFHRVLGEFLVGLVRKHGLDGMAVKAYDIKEYLGMASLRGARVERILKDVKPIFPDCVILKHPGRYDSFYGACMGSLWFCAFRTSDAWPGDNSSPFSFRMKDEDRAGMIAGGLSSEGSAKRFGVLKVAEYDRLTYDHVIQYQHSAGMGLAGRPFDFEVVLPVAWQKDKAVA